VRRFSKCGGQGYEIQTADDRDDILASRERVRGNRWGAVDTGLGEHKKSDGDKCESHGGSRMIVFYIDRDG